MLKIVGNRFIILLKDKLNISFCLKKGYVRKFITLGMNCFPRKYLTKFCIKAKKSDGELSYPFDLCFAPLVSIGTILSNNFSDFYEDLFFDEERNYWVNKKYEILFIHDKNMSLENFKDRYDKRINNFKQVFSNIDDMCLISVIFDESYNESLYLSIYNSLKKYSGKNFRYLVINVVPKRDNLKRIFISDNLMYKEIAEPCENYKNLWMKAGMDKKIPSILDFYKEYIDTVLEFSHL